MSWKAFTTLFDIGLRTQVHAFETAISNWVQPTVGMPAELAAVRSVRILGRAEFDFETGPEEKVTRIVVETELEGWFSAERVRAICTRFGTEYTYGQCV